MELEQKLRNFILENYLFTDDQTALNSTDSFMEKGIIDSTGILELIFFIEEELEVKVKDEDMVQENLDSVNKLVAFIRKIKPDD